MRWLIGLLLVLGLMVAAWTVPIGGRTLWQRIQGPAEASPEDPRQKSAGSQEHKGKKVVNRGTKTAPVVVAKDADQHPDLHTEADRKALDALIDRKLQARP